MGLACCVVRFCVARLDDSAVGAVGDSDAGLSDNEVWLPSRLSTLGFE
jgi:hypothetical protein